LLEEHPQVGSPSHCSGVVSLKGLELLGLDAHSSFSQKLIHGARFYPPQGEPIEVRKKEPVALILNRMKLDQFLAKQAVAAGVELFFGSKRAPGFFAWSIPTGKNSARVGLASKKGNVKKFLDDLVKEQWPNATVDATKSGSVLVAGPVPRCWSPGFIVVGDAGGQVKQTTGGGIVIGGYCGKLSGIAAASAATNVGIQAEQFLRNYDA